MQNGDKIAQAGGTAKVILMLKVGFKIKMEIGIIFIVTMVMISQRDIWHMILLLMDTI